MSKPALLKYTEWQGSSGLWYCNDVSDFTSKRGLWYVPARLLKISLDNFVEMLIKDFEVDYIAFNEILIYGWYDQNKMRKFKNWINAEARKRNFII